MFFLELVLFCLYISLFVDLWSINEDFYCEVQSGNYVYKFSHILGTICYYSNYKVVKNN